MHSSAFKYHMQACVAPHSAAFLQAHLADMLHIAVACVKNDACV